jgi:alkanesulfonate monooxygenase SsuD/methylene tetrahydromethanopterin reductase-like flavin-dependent oxidoreductase (luciferase family)
MISTMDVATGGRMNLGVGARWKEDEWLAYGYGFPSTRERLANLGDHLAVLTEMMRPGTATYQEVYASVIEAIDIQVVRGRSC